MLKQNPFMLPTEQYTRKLNFFGDYVKDSAYYIAKMTGDRYTHCYDWVLRNIKPEGLFPIKDPDVLTIKTDANTLDRSLEVISLGTYLKEAIMNNDLIAPTFSVFYQPTERKSFQPPYIRKNIKLRSKFKKEKFSLKMAGENTGSAIADKRQNNRKTSNNAVSGTYTIPSTPLAFPPAHAVLTSTCRATSGYGNANNEKMIAGNRHYWSPNVVFNNITSIVTHTDYDDLQAVMEEFQLHYPTTEEVMRCIRRGAYHYWRDERQYSAIEQYVDKLTPLEKAAFVYTGDLYHLRILNESFMRNMIADFIKPYYDSPVDSASYIKEVEPDIYSMAMQIHEDDVRGIAVNNLEFADFESVATFDQEDFVMVTTQDSKDLELRRVLDEVTATAINIENQITRYFKLIKTFFTTTNVPASLAHFPSSVREVVLASDTDSTIFTAQDWVLWYTNNDYTHRDADGVGGLICLFASQTITHLLALMSANFGIQSDNLFVIAMKNEFKFDIFAPTQVNKHYMATITIQEGNVYKNPDREIKGVHMKASNAPAKVNKDTKEMMYQVMDDIRNGKKIKLTKWLKEIANKEREIIESIKHGSSEYTRLGKIKEPDAYPAGVERSPYQYHIFWNEVFGPKYGMVQEPPYLTVKIKTDDLSSASRIKEWCASLEDQELAKRMLDYCVNRGKTNMKTMYIPESIVQGSTGIPTEILEAANYRGTIRNIHSIYYLILTTLGFFIQDDKANRLVSDYY